MIDYGIMKIYDLYEPMSKSGRKRKEKRERESYLYGENLSLMKRAIARAKY